MAIRRQNLRNTVDKIIADSCNGRVDVFKECCNTKVVKKPSKKKQRKSSRTFQERVLLEMKMHKRKEIKKLYQLSPEFPQWTEMRDALLVKLCKYKCLLKCIRTESANELNEKLANIVIRLEQSSQQTEPVTTDEQQSTKAKKQLSIPPISMESWQKLQNAVLQKAGFTDIAQKVHSSMTLEEKYELLKLVIDSAAQLNALKHRSSNCTICKFLDRRKKEVDSPLIKEMKQQNEKHELHDYYTKNLTKLNKQSKLMERSNCNCQSSTQRNLLSKCSDDSINAINSGIVAYITEEVKNLKNENGKCHKNLKDIACLMGDASF